MRFFLTSIAVLFSVLQALINYAWQLDDENVTSSFTSSIRMLYGEVPVWTEVAFSFGNWWYVVSIAIAILAVVGYFVFSSRKAVALVTVIAIAGAFAMVYAMYPVHLMIAGSWV